MANRTLRSAKRVEQITALYLAGKTPCEIVECMNAEGHTLTVDAVLKAEAHAMALARELREAMDVAQARAEEIEYHKRLYAEHWRAYERSCEDEVVATQGVNDGVKYAKVVKTNRHGDPVHLREARECRKRIAQLQGLDAPIKIAPTNPAGDEPYVLAVKDMTRAELEAIDALATRLASITASGGTGGAN